MFQPMKNSWPWVKLLGSTETSNKMRFLLCERRETRAVGSAVLNMRNLGEFDQGTGLQSRAERPDLGEKMTCKKL